jgi:hypothetical protein
MITLTVDYLFFVVLQGRGLYELACTCAVYDLPTCPDPAHKGA